LKYKIYINGDYEKILITENKIKIKNNLKYSFNNFIDITIKRWYYIIFTLLIPAYFWLKKKLKKNKLIFLYFLIISYAEFNF
jgi:hypothetical protein